MNKKYKVNFDGATDSVKEAIARLFFCMNHIHQGDSTSVLTLTNYIDREESFLAEMEKRGITVFTVYISAYNKYVALYIRPSHLDFDNVIITSDWIEFRDMVRGEEKVVFTLFSKRENISHEFPLKWAEQWLTKLREGEFQIVKE